MAELPTLLVLNKIDAVEDKDELAFWKSVFPDALPASAKEGEGIVELTEVVRDQMLGQVMRATVSVPLADSKGTTFVEKFSEVLERDYDSEPGVVKLTVEMSQRIMDQLANNVPSAKVLKVSKSAGKGGGKKVVWRCRTKMIKELIPEDFFEERGRRRVRQRRVLA